VSGTPDTIHQRGRDAVLAGRELLDVPPGPGSTRWGLSLDVFPDAEGEARLAALADEAAALAGPGQWRTGGTGSAHLTVTYLERAWREVGADDPEVRRHAEHLRRLGLAAADGLHHAQDVAPLHLLQRDELGGVVAGDEHVRAAVAPDLLGQIVDGDLLVAREGDRPLDAVLELSNVSRPVVVDHLLERPPGDADLSVVFPVELCQEMLRQQRDVLVSLP